MLRRSGALVAAAIVFTACGSSGDHPVARTTSSTAAATPARDPARDHLPLVAELHAGASTHSFQGGDDHLTLAVENRGRDIQDLVVDAPEWLAEHDGFGMGSSRSCVPDVNTGRVHCGPVFAGQSADFILRTFPAHVGTFRYELRLFDEEPAGLLPLTSADGSPLAYEYVEVVDPVTNQIPGANLPTPPPAG